MTRMHRIEECRFHSQHSQQTLSGSQKPTSVRGRGTRQEAHWPRSPASRAFPPPPLPPLGIYEARGARPARAAQPAAFPRVWDVGIRRPTASGVLASHRTLNEPGTASHTRRRYATARGHPAYSPYRRGQGLSGVQSATRHDGPLVPNHCLRVSSFNQSMPHLAHHTALRPPSSPSPPTPQTMTS